MLPDFSDWSRADVMAALSLGISFAALIVSLIAAAASYAQARAAWKAHRKAVDDERPLIDGVVTEPFPAWPSATRVRFVVRNRSPREIVVRTVAVTTFGMCCLAHEDACEAIEGFDPVPKAVPPPRDAGLTIDFDRRISRVGTATRHDRDHSPFDLVVWPAPHGLFAGLRRRFPPRHLRLKISVIVNTASDTIITETLIMPQPSMMTPQ